MKQFWQTFLLCLMLLVTWQVMAVEDDTDFDQSSRLQSLAEVNNDGDEDSTVDRAIKEARLMRLQAESRALSDWLAEVSGSTTGELDKRYKPSGFLGSRGKRFTPRIDSLLLARYYQDADKWKRQPHLGFHGSRG